jgi:hypothetical protein
MPGGAAFNQLHPEALPVQRCGQGEPGDASSDDQDPFNVSHFFLPSPLFCLSGAFFSVKRLFPNWVLAAPLFCIVSLSAFKLIV